MEVDGPRLCASEILPKEIGRLARGSHGRADTWRLKMMYYYTCGVSQHNAVYGNLVGGRYITHGRPIRAADAQVRPSEAKKGIRIRLR